MFSLDRLSIVVRLCFFGEKTILHETGNSALKRKSYKLPDKGGIPDLTSFLVLALEKYP